MLDINTSWEEKIKKPYGVDLAKSIGGEWFGNSTITSGCTFSARRNNIIEKRKRVRGEQSVKAYKDHAERMQGDMAYRNGDFRPINISGKFCNIVSNGIRDDYYKIDIRANDRHTILTQKNKEQRLRDLMLTMPLLKRTKEVLGIDMIPKGFIPEDEEELKLYSEIKDRPKIEIAEEITIDSVKSVNNFQNIEDIKNKDAVEIGLFGTRIWTDPRNGIRMKSIDPENLVHSHVKNNDFSDAYYFGEVESVTLNDIKVNSDLSQVELREVAKTYAGNNDSLIQDFGTCDMDKLLGFKVDILHFAYKDTKEEVYKVSKRKGKTTGVKKKDSNFNPPKRSDYEKIVDSNHTWLEGVYIIGTEHVYNYKESENILFDELNNPLPQFVIRATAIYKNELHSFLDDIEVLEDQMQHIHFKIQHLVSELKPDLTIINIDALADLTGSVKDGEDEEGNKVAVWQEAIRILGVKGVIIEKTIDMGEAGVQKAQSARPVAQQQGSGITVLLNSWAHYYNAIREVTGVNPARDGSLSEDALLGVNKMAELASNTVTHHIVQASIEWNLRVAKTISNRIHDIFADDDAKHLQKMYKEILGKYNLEALKAMKSRALADFGFSANMIPTKLVVQKFMEDLAISLQAQTITVEIKSEAQEIAKTNIKKANQYLFYMTRKLKQQRMEEEAKLSQVKSQNDIQSAQASQQAQVQAYQAKKGIDLQYEKNLAEIEVLKQLATQQVESPVKQKEFEQNVYLEQLRTMSKFKLDEYKETKKDDRVSQQSTEQSKLINQRANNTEPIDFTNNVFGDIFKT